MAEFELEADAEAFLTKAREIVAEATRPESEKHVGKPV